MVRDYELMYIVRPDLDDEALRTATESVDTLIRGLGGTVGKTTMWGKRRLAYEVDRLRDTLQGLLRIALAESGTAPLEDVDLSRLAGDLVEFYQPVAEPGLLEVALAPGLVVRGHRQLLSQALANLLDNAFKYGRGTPIAVALAARAGCAELTVRDLGPGIPPEYRELATQRFRRLPGSSGLPGSGLGLSLVAAVARLHHAELALEDAAPGLRVVLRLPLVPPGG